ncbi:MAG: hypothetical protein ACT4P6_14425 [Gemmatimonadaceae bacterium]
MTLSSAALGYAGFLRGLPAFLRQRLNVDDARAIIQRRLAERESNFLATVERSVFHNTVSPYRKLMNVAGCTADDVRRLVTNDGIEGALLALRESGVYVSFEEFKGTQPIRRGSQQVAVRPEDFDNPRVRSYHAVATGGSTGGGRRVLMDLEHLTSRLPTILLSDVYHGLFGIPTVFWFEIPPGNGMDSVLQRVPVQNIPERWFSPIRGGRDGAGWRFRLATAAAVTVARATGARIPRAEYLPLSQAHVIAEWAREALRRRGACGIRAHVSKALRVCIAAREAGIDLTGTVFVIGGEPPTPAKVAEITRTGARFYSNYYFTEGGPVGSSCTTSEHSNDQHFHADHLALIQVSRQVPGFDVSVPSFHFTTLLPTAPKVLLNVESDDFGIVERHHCGCPYEALGLTTHIKDIRSFRKLTGEGVTLIGSDMVEILETELPARFGGSSLDYQLVEEEDERGFTRLTLLVHPRVTLPDESAPIEAILNALARRGGAADMSRGVWSQAGSFRVRREAPGYTARGKFLPLRLKSSSATADSLARTP